jgi:hypothetical protein
MKEGDVGRLNVLEKMFGYVIGGRVVPQGDVCKIGENPLSKDGRFLNGIGFPARDKWQIVFIKFLDNVFWMRVRGRGMLFSVADVCKRRISQPVGQPDSSWRVTSVLCYVKHD